jgi:hypothetical protein
MRKNFGKRDAKKTIKTKCSKTVKIKTSSIMNLQPKNNISVIMFSQYFAQRFFCWTT